jgi:hypothetical protein
MVVCTEYSKEAQFFDFYYWMNFFLVVMVLHWHKLFSDLKQSNGIMKNKAESDKWIHDYNGLYDTMTLKNYVQTCSILICIVSVMAE